MPQDEQNLPRPFWSGVLAFGLVSVPVALFPANRSTRVRLRMVDRDGTALRRRYFCAAEEEMIQRDEIVRGYEVASDRFVIVEDEELEALAPKRSREIDLNRFVPTGDLDPMYFQRAYFLVPQGDTTKAYRLLARAMEEAQRAGIATFVMRGKEYLVAIIAQGGILRAETMRFSDEIRSPEQIGLDSHQDASGKRTRGMCSAIEKLHAAELERGELQDEKARKLRETAERKLAADQDIVRHEEAPEEDEDEESESTNVVDLMEVLKQRLQGKSGGEAASGRAELRDLSKDELYERARDRDISGRSSMTKAELVEALARTRG